MAKIEAAIRMPGFDLEGLLPIMKSFIVEQLQEKRISEKESIDICLGDLEIDDVCLNETLWFSDYFPKNIRMAEILETYKVLSNGNSGSGM